MKTRNMHTDKPSVKNTSSDITDTASDQKELNQDAISITLPEVKDIPGQEHIKVPNFREMQDTTISSADEEGEGLLDDLNKDDDDDDIDDTNSNVTEEERKLLRKSAGHPDTDETQDLNKLALDNTDNEGDKLNEKSLNEDKIGADLDAPGTDLDDEDEETGAEDEENNLYSQRD